MTQSFLSSRLFRDRLNSSFSFCDVLASLPKPRYESRGKDFALRSKIPGRCKVDSSPTSGGHITLSLESGLVFLEKSLFATYIYSSITNPETGEEDEPPVFQISLSSLLEALQIFGINDAKDRWSTREPVYGGFVGSLMRGGPAAAFENKALGMTGMCKLSYAGPGDPLCIILEETGVTTSCELVTYEPEFEEDIPLQQDALAHKVIMRASWLHDAITELSSTSPTRLTITASPTAPCFTLSSAGPLGSATVEFSNKANLLETFQVPKRTSNIYKFSLIKGAIRAMAIASKVSIRADEQGVLSLQFMVEVDSGGVSFVDFRFVPFEPEEGEDDEDIELSNEAFP